MNAHRRRPRVALGRSVAALLGGATLLAGCSTSNPSATATLRVVWAPCGPIRTTAPIPSPLSVKALVESGPHSAYWHLRGLHVAASGHVPGGGGATTLHVDPGWYVVEMTTVWEAQVHTRSHRQSKVTFRTGC